MPRPQKWLKDVHCCQTADVCIKNVSSYWQYFTLFESVVKKRFGSCIQSIRFWDDLNKESTSVVDCLDK